MLRPLTLILFLILIAIEGIMGQLAFPEKIDVEKSKMNIQGRQPLFSPARCKEHELLYPGDQKNDWICDCAPGAIYYPESDACFPAFRQGPCATGDFLVLGNSAVVPECIKNECKSDGLVQILNVCYELGKAGPCPNAELSYVLGVDPTNIHIDCIKLSINFGTRFGDEPTHPYDLANVELCARGCKRAIQGRCPEKK